MENGPNQLLQGITLAVPTYDRRETLLSLLRDVAPQLRAVPGSRILVASDGSTDGTHEAVADLDVGVPLELIALPHRGAAASRNALIEQCQTRLIWFLDDDMRPTPGMLEQHLGWHHDGIDRLVIGPCVIPDNANTLPSLREFWHDWNEKIAEDGRILAFDTFSIANTSGPVSIYRDVGGLDDTLVGYGFEDYELGLRLMRADIPIYVDPEAIAIHDQERTLAQSCENRREAGANLVRFIRLHPDVVNELIEGQHLSPGALALIGRLHDPGHLARVSALVCSFEGLLHRTVRRGSGRLRRLAQELAFAAGTLQAGGDSLLERVIERNRPT